MAEWKQIERDVRIIQDYGYRNVRRIVRDIQEIKDEYTGETVGTIGTIRYAGQELEVELMNGMFVAYGI